MRATGKLAAALAVVPAFAFSSGAQGQAVGWQHRPSAEDIEAVYPLAAKQKGVAGQAWLSCSVERDGQFTDCEVAGETPADQGFGAAALLLSKSMQATPRTTGPEKMGVTIPIRFGGPTPVHPARAASFKTTDGRFSIKDARWRKLAPIGPYWPEIALRLGVGGHAEIDCKVGADETLRDCAIVGDRTTHPMFGEAMLAMARRGWMVADVATTSPATEDGVWRFSLDFPPRTLADTR